MNNNLPARSMPVAMVKGGPGSSNEFLEYRSALSMFSDDTLTQVYNLMFNDGKDQSQMEERVAEGTSLKKPLPQKTSAKDHSKLISLFHTCQASATAIAKLEATPGFLQTVTDNLHNSNKIIRPQKMGGMMLAAKIQSSNPIQPERGVILNLPKHKQLKRRNSNSTASSSNYSNVDNSTNPHKQQQQHAIHHHYISQHINLKRKMKQQSQQQQGSLTSAPNSPYPQHHKPLQQENNTKDENSEVIPKAALNFLAALNAKRPKSPSPMTVMNTSTSTERMQHDKKDVTADSVNQVSLKRKRSTHNYKEDDDSSSSGVTDNEEDNDESDKSTLSDKGKNESKYTRKKQKSNEQEDKFERENDNIDDSVQINYKVRKTNDIGSSPTRLQSKSDSLQRESSSSDFSSDEKSSVPYQNDDKQQRLRGRLDVVYDVGDEVAVYFKPDNIWYQATIKAVKFWDTAGVATERSGYSKPSGRRNHMNQNKDSTNTDGDVRVKYYDVEYDNGEIGKYVIPEDVMDKLDD